MTSIRSTFSAPNGCAPFRGNRHPDLLGLHKPEYAQHLVQFYDDDSIIIENVSFLSARSLAADDSVVVLATESHRERIEKRLVSFGLDVKALLQSRRFVAVDATETLSRFMVDGWPDEAKFEAVVGEIIREAGIKSAHGFVFAFGEMVALLCAASNAAAAIRLEQLWNALGKRHRFSLYCAYSLSSLATISDADAFIEICAEHALTIPTENGAA